MYLTEQKLDYGRREFIRNIALDIVLAVFTCGLWNIFVQYRQIKALNYFLDTQKYSFALWALFTLLTCGLYHLYHEYRMSQDLQVLAHSTQEMHMPVVHLLLTAFGLSIVTDALQQAHINQMLGHDGL